MKVEYVNPFVKAATSVLKTELGSSAERLEMSLKHEPVIGGDVNVIVGITGQVVGQVIYSMGAECATAMASVMIGEPVGQLDELAKSALAELSNMITGHAAIGLAESGFSCVITPPALLTGREVILTTFFPVLSVPFRTKFGDVRIDVALKEKTC